MTPEHAALLAEIAARREAAAGISGFTAEAIADGHVPQLQLMRDGARRVLALCSRRAGKSRGLCGLMALDAVFVPEIQIYFGATKPAVRLMIWERIWKPLCKAWNLPCRHNETMMISTFVGGGVVVFTGTDDTRHVETYLGGRIWRAIIDEAQSQPDNVLVPLTQRILPPALSDAGLKGQLILAGTIPEVEAGLFYRAWKHGKGWGKHNWSRFDNPHMGTVEEQRTKMLEECESSNLDEADPLIQREWHGRFVFSKDATAYRYDVERNGYVAEVPDWFGGAEDWLAATYPDVELAFAHPMREGADGGPRFGMMAAEPHPGIDRFSAALDPGALDRWAFEVTGWGAASQEVQHVFEWATPRRAHVTWGQVAPIMALVQLHYGPDFWFYDAGGSQVELDTFRADYGIPVIRAASKGDMPGQIKRENDLLGKGWSKIMIGSALEQDYQRARRDPKREPGAAFKWAAAWHPDPSEAKRYADQGYFSAFEPSEPPVSEEQRQREAHALQLRRVAARRRGRRLDEDGEARALDDSALWG